LTFSKEFMQKALKRIDELQDDMIQQSKLVDGADEYVKQKMELFNEDEKLRQKIKTIKVKEQDLTESFLTA